MLEISTNYYSATADLAFFSQLQWASTIQTILNVVNDLMIETYAANGSVNPLPYSFTRLTTSGTETLSNTGRGHPVQAGIGLIRSFFRPSDDATTFQLFVPTNMMFSRYLASCAAIMQSLDLAPAGQMSTLASSLRTAIETHGIVTDLVYG